MKVVLINAPSKHAALVTSGWDRKAEDIGAFPPIGLSYIAGFLTKHTKHDVKIIDAIADGLGYEELGQQITQLKPDIVGTTVFTQTFYDTLLLAQITKKISKTIYFCVGGTQHLRMFLGETLSHSEIDFAVRGEGEVIFANLLEALELNKPLHEVEGISFKKNGEIISVGEEGYMKEINEFPPPAFEMLPTEKYKSAIGSGKTAGTIATSRGCPYQCRFCDHPYRTYRAYSTERILSEINYFYVRGIREFVFFDDMFNITPKRVIELSAAMLKVFPNIAWSFRGRADQVTEEMILIAKKAGCNQMMFGIEAANDEDLKSIKKNITIKQLVDTLALCKKHGIETSTNWIIGLPCHKSRKDILDLLNFTIKCGTDYVQFNILVPFAGTEIYAEGVKKNIIDPDFWKRYVLNPQPNSYAPVWDEYLTRDELSELLKTCYRKFYLRPVKIMDHVFRVKSFSHLKEKARGALVVMGVLGFKRHKVPTIERLD
jgi:radical SAM superfamily enzyme YgiQ (UPF0313 family)